MFQTGFPPLYTTRRFGTVPQHRWVARPRGRGPPLTAEGHTTSGDPEDLAVAAITGRPVYPVAQSGRQAGWLLLLRLKVQRVCPVRHVAVVVVAVGEGEQQSCGLSAKIANIPAQ